VHKRSGERETITEDRGRLVFLTGRFRTEQSRDLWLKETAALGAKINVVSHEPGSGWGRHKGGRPSLGEKQEGGSTTSSGSSQRRGEDRQNAWAKLKDGKRAGSTRYLLPAATTTKASRKKETKKMRQALLCNITGPVENQRNKVQTDRERTGSAGRGGEKVMCLVVRIR